VIPRICSSGRESRYRILPASFGEMMPFVAIRESESDVLPWSWWGLSKDTVPYHENILTTWAMMQIFSDTLVGSVFEIGEI